jgi:prevent-host-death family protein
VAEIGIKQLKAEVSEVVQRVQDGTAYVVTKRGRPAAVILPIDEAEDVVLASANEYVRMRREGRAAYRQQLTTSLEDVD